MTLWDWKTACRLIPLVAMLCTSQVAFSQVVREAEPMETRDLEGDSVHEPNEPGNAFDILARSFSKKKRSELINLKTYTDEEWDQAERAVEANRKACRKGDAIACKAAGDAYVSGDGVWPVSAIAYILYKEACDAGLGAGCIAFVDLAKTGYGYPEGGYEETYGLLEKACGLGDLIGCDRFAEELRSGEVAPPDLARSDEVLELACKAGGAGACISMGEHLVWGQEAEAQDRGAVLLDAMCRKSALEACQILANSFGSRPDPDEWLVSQYKHFSCYLDSVSDCMDMGDRTYKGVGSAQNRDLALVYYSKACQIEPYYCEVVETVRAMPRLRSACTANDPQACAELGRALSNSQSPEYDRETALPLLESSCRIGVGDTCSAAVAIIYADNPARSERIGELLESGCEANDQNTCFELARSLEQGEPGSTNLERAVALYSRLCDADYPDACVAESKYAGIVASARIAPADESFIAPLLSNGPTNVFRRSDILEVCFTGSERFRGKTYTEYQCERSEKGIGSQRTRPGQAPWQALLWRPEVLAGNRLSAAQRVLCGGSLIAQGWVLTAAHCLTDNGTRVRDGGHRIRLGVYNPRLDEGVSYPILRTIPHPQYDQSNKYVFDIALIQYDHLEGRVGSGRGPRATGNPIFSISLDPLDVGERRITKGMTVFSYGWGWTEAEKSNSTDYLQIVKMELSSENACTALTGFKNNLSNAALCAGGKNREQTCFGDSGGPLVFYGDGGARPILVGVVSAGKACGTTGRLSQYTRVAKVRSWIAAYVPNMR